MHQLNQIYRSLGLRGGWELNNTGLALSLIAGMLFSSWMLAWAISDIELKACPAVEQSR